MTGGPLGRALDRAVALTGDALGRHDHVVHGRAARARREVLLRRLDLLGRANRVPVEADVALDADVALGVHVTLRGAGPVHLRLGPQARLESGSSLVLTGGARLDIAEAAHVRRGAVLNVSGTLELGRQVIVSWGSVLHAAESVRIGDRAGVAERVTIADSTHLQPTPDAWFYEHSRSGPVSVGHDTWVCPGAVLTHRAQVGAWCVVAAGAVVTGVVPDGSIALGSPAVSRSRGLSWVA